MTIATRFVVATLAAAALFPAERREMPPRRQARSRRASSVIGR